MQFSGAANSIAGDLHLLIGFRQGSFGTFAVIGFIITIMIIL